MKTKLSMAIRADTKDGSAVLSLMGDDLAAVMDTMHDVAVKVGQWADLPPGIGIADGRNTAHSGGISGTKGGGEPWRTRRGKRRSGNWPG